MANQYLINLLIKGFDDNIEYEVREGDWERAQGLFEQADFAYRSCRCLVFDSVDGLAVAVSIADIQSVQFLQNVLEFASDQKHKDDDVHVWLKGRDEPISVVVGEEKDSLSAFFIFLDSGAETEAFPGFFNIDGELVRFNSRELVMATAPLHVLNEGFRELKQDSGFDEGDESTGIPF